jgi:hypothetical protein
LTPHDGAGCEPPDRVLPATGGLVGGHALKHLLAAAAGIAALMPLWTGAGRRVRAGTG